MQKSNKNIYYLIIILIYVILSQKVFCDYGQKFTNIINPIFWIISLITMYIAMPPKIINKRNEKKIVQYTIVGALVYIIVYFLSGLFVTFGRNPYSNTFSGIITNLWVTGIVIVGREYTRYKIIAATNKKDKQKISIITIIIFTLIEFDLISFISSITNLSLVFKQVVSVLIPAIAKNVLFTTIVEKYSCKASIIYEISTKMFFWISPILPNSPWILVSILDTTILLILLVYVQTNIENTQNIILNRRTEETNPADIIKLGVVLVPAVCFAIGLFPIHPRAIATASMYPEIEVGDVVIVKKCEINDIKEGDVIEYKIEDQNIVHRVTKIEVEKNTFKITTKGDNNRSEDANPVYQEQLIGKVVFKVKYIGLPSIWLNKLTNSNQTIHVETGK